LKLAIVSPYPPPGRKHIYDSGVASYTKNLVCELKKLDTEMEIHVVADRNPTLQKHYIDNGVRIHRVFDRGTCCYIKIFKTLRKIRPDVVHIQHEYFLYGGIFSASLFPLLVLLSRLVSRKVIVTLHGVIPLNLLKDPKFRRENGIEGPQFLLKVGLWIVTKLISLLTHVIVVHDPLLKRSLIENYGVNQAKIKVIPHGVEKAKLIPQEEAKKNLALRGRKIILFFGYLAGYKGLESLIEAYKHVASQLIGTTLVIAGGEHPRLKCKPQYKQWLNKLMQKAEKINQELKENGEIIFTGYVPENVIPIYYSAADLVVLPYKAKMAASGPESLAISFEKPYIVTIVRSGDKSKLAMEIMTALKSRLEELKKRSKLLRKLREWRHVAIMYLNIYQGGQSC